MRAWLQPRIKLKRKELIGDYILDAGGERGYITLDLPTILFTIVVSSIIIVGLLLMQNVGAEIVGGVIGGLVALIASAFFPWWRTKYSLFELRFLNPTDKIKPERMRQYTAVRMKTGNNKMRISLRPRKGMILRKIGFSFFYPGLVPWRPGRRRSTDEISVDDLRHQQDDHSWDKLTLTREEPYCYADLPPINIAGGSRRIFEIDAKVSTAIDSWEGIMGFRIDYYSSGNPDMKYVNTKCLIGKSGRRRPFRAIGKSILDCTTRKPEIGKKDSQTQ